MNLKSLIDDALELLYPARCPFCDRVLPFGELACEDCEKRLVYEGEPRCMKCGRSLSEDSDASLCNDCADHSHRYDYGYCLLPYRCVSRSMYRMKYSGRREYGKWYGRQVGRVLRREIMRMCPDALIPVPIHKKRMAKRGYNQADCIAKAISEELGIPVDRELVARVENTPPMKAMDDKHKRRNNLKNAFQITKSVVEYNSVLVVDDIYTSGATVDAVARELKRAGVARVFYVAAAGSHL